MNDYSLNLSKVIYKVNQEMRRKKLKIEIKGMRPEDIRAELIRLNVTVGQIGTLCNTSRQMAHKVVYRDISRGHIAYRVKRKIAETLEMDFQFIWGEPDNYWYGKFI